MSAKGRALAGQASAPFVLWAAETGADFERLDESFDYLVDAVAAAEDIAAQRRHVAIHVRQGKRVVRRFLVGDQEAA